MCTCMSLPLPENQDLLLQVLPPSNCSAKKVHFSSELSTKKKFSTSFLLIFLVTRSYYFLRNYLGIPLLRSLITVTPEAFTIISRKSATDTSETRFEHPRKLIPDTGTNRGNPSSILRGSTGTRCWEPSETPHRNSVNTLQRSPKHVVCKP